MLQSILTNNLDSIQRLCHQHRVKKLYVFGSVCTNYFNESSDVDFLLTFDSSYFDGYEVNFFSLEEQLQKLLERVVNLLTEDTLKNPYFIKVVNRTKTPIYEG
ncbi:MAG: nucleotidyltransferase domain-containing protein [Chitinophagales bacterium]|nr:nucleotidyltransferase domain-containing protein [Chitinophagales bacterium]